MSALAEYENKYQSARLERREGVLQVTLHSEGQSLRWGFLPHGELPELFHDIAADRDNRVVILTGTGAEFSGPRDAGNLVLSVAPDNRAYRPHSLGGPASFDEPAQYRGAGHQRDQWSGVAALGNPAAL